MKRSTMVLSLALVFAACGGTTGEGSEESSSSSCIGGKCDAAGLEAIAGGLWASCELTDDAAGKSVVRCETLDEGELVPLESVSVRGFDDDGVIVADGLQTADGERDFPAVIESGEYPLDLHVTLHLDDEHDVNGLNTRRVTTRVRLQAAADMKGENKLVFEQPFDVWPVQIASDQSLFILESRTEVDAGYVNPDGSPRPLILQPSVFGREGVTNALIAVPREVTELTADMRWGDALTEAATVLEGPGRYVVDADGLRPAGDIDQVLFKDAEPPIEPEDPEDPEKPEEPPCEVDYAAFLIEFAAGLSGDGSEARATLGELECVPRTKESYAAWHELFVRELDELAPLPGGELHGDEIGRIDAVLAATPAATDDESYIRWHTHYGERLDVYMPLRHGIVQEEEAKVLDPIERARPDATGDTAYAAWFERHEAMLEAFVPADNGVLQEDEANNLARHLEQRPDATGAASYDLWLGTYVMYFDVAVPRDGGILQQDERERLGAVKLSRPRTSENEAYENWLGNLTPILVAAGSTVSSDERAGLEEFASVKPSCVDDVAAATAVLDETKASLSANGDVLAELGAPAACSAD